MNLDILCIYTYIETHTNIYIYIISALGIRGLPSFRTPMEHHTHPTLQATDLGNNSTDFDDISFRQVGVALNFLDMLLSAVALH
jgi:hypothetical protein